MVFVEVNTKILSPSLQHFYRELKQQGNYHLYIHCLEDITSGKGKYISNALRCLKEIATANHVILSHGSRMISCITPRKETQIIQLWHACGAFKRFGLSTAKLKFGGDYQESERYPYYRNLDLVTVSSPEVIWAYAEAMNIAPENNIIQATGIGRTDVFFNEEFKIAAKKRIETVLPPHDKRRWLLWAPTFRGHVNTAVTPDYPDLEAMKEALADKYILLIKQHPLIKNRPKVPDRVQDFAFDVSDNCSIEDLICNCDMCISDYSSLVFEYSLRERPMLFFAMDKADYEDWNGFYYPYKEMMPGPIVSSTDELIASIQRMEKHFDSSEVIAFQKKFMGACDGLATPRILKSMKDFSKNNR